MARFNSSWQADCRGDRSTLCWLPSSTFLLSLLLSVSNLSRFVLFRLLIVGIL